MWLNFSIWLTNIWGVRAEESWTGAFFSTNVSFYTLLLNNDLYGSIINTVQAWIKWEAGRPAPWRCYLWSLISRKCVWRCRYFTISLGQYLLEIAASMSGLPLLRGVATRPESEFCQTLHLNDIASVDLLHVWDHRRSNKTTPPLPGA